MGALMEDELMPDLKVALGSLEVEQDGEKLVVTGSVPTPAAG